MKSILLWYKSVGIDNLMLYPQDNNPKQNFTETREIVQEEENLPSTTNLSEIKDTETLKRTIENIDCELKSNATNMVFGHGNQTPDIVLVGEAPGKDEDASGLPFVGQSGQLLTNILESVHLSREDVYITNVIPWRPKNNRTPSTDEISFFTPFLKKHIELLNPKIIITLGSVATKALLNSSESMLSLRGKWQNLHVNGKNIPVMPTYHPSYLLRSSSNKKVVWIDFITMIERYNSLK